MKNLTHIEVIVTLVLTVSDRLSSGRQATDSAVNWVKIVKKIREILSFTH